MDNTPASGLNDTCRQVTSPTFALTSVPVDFYTFYYSLILVMAVIAVVGNVLVIKVICGNRALRSPANYFVISLAVSDLMQGVAYPVYNVSHMELPEILLTLGEYRYTHHRVLVCTNSFLIFYDG